MTFSVSVLSVRLHDSQKWVIRVPNEGSHPAPLDWLRRARHCGAQVIAERARIGLLQAEQLLHGPSTTTDDLRTWSRLLPIPNA